MYVMLSCEWDLRGRRIRSKSYSLSFISTCFIDVTRKGRHYTESLFTQFFFGKVQILHYRGACGLRNLVKTHAFQETTPPCLFTQKFAPFLSLRAKIRTKYKQTRNLIMHHFFLHLLLHSFDRQVLQVLQGLSGHFEMALTGRKN